jgi:hypothetical protein
MARMIAALSILLLGMIPVETMSSELLNVGALNVGYIEAAIDDCPGFKMRNPRAFFNLSMEVIAEPRLKAAAARGVDRFRSEASLDGLTKACREAKKEFPEWIR